MKGLPRYSSAPCRLPHTRSLSWFFELTSTTGMARVRSSRLRLRRIRSRFGEAYDIEEQQVRPLEDNTLFKFLTVGKADNS